MTSETQVELVKRYFDAVDAENLSGLLDTLAPVASSRLKLMTFNLKGTLRYRKCSSSFGLITRPFCTIDLRTSLTSLVRV